MPSAKRQAVKNLPTPSEEAQKHSAQLTQRIAKTINRQGPLPFSKFMEMALYTPQLGYYSGALQKFGGQGDFITAPEVSNIFSRCLARQAAQILSQLNQPNIVEFGAGQGTMAKDILLELSTINQALENYYIIEISADLKQRQQLKLQAELPAELFAKVTWLDSLPKQAISAVVLANEVLDAMPFERLRIEPDSAKQGFVNFDQAKQQLVWDYQPITDKSLRGFSNQLIKHIGEVSELGYETEINQNILPWLKSIDAMLSQGIVLLIDYGYTRHEYYQPARVMGTLRCHYQHRAHSNPFYYPGLQDITAHVDFTAVAESAYDSGFKVAGYTTQAHFLMATGLLEMSVNPEADIDEQVRIAQQIKTLTLPDEMGENFKVMGLSKDIDQSLMGFSIRDLRHQL